MKHSAIPRALLIAQAVLAIPAGAWAASTGPGASGIGLAAATGSATLSWSAPTTDTSGKALTNLSGYVIRYGTTRGSLNQLIRLPTTGIQTYVIDNLPAGTWYFGVKAVTSAGTRSVLSNVVSKTIG